MWNNFLQKHWQSWPVGDAATEEVVMEAEAEAEVVAEGALEEA